MFPGSFGPTSPDYPSRYLRCIACGYKFYENNFTEPGCPACKGEFVIEEDAPDGE